MINEARKSMEKLPVNSWQLKPRVIQRHQSGGVKELYRPLNSQIIPFQGFGREMAQDFKTDLRVQSSAIGALQVNIFNLPPLEAP